MAALEEVFQHFQPRLESLVQFRVSEALRSRLDVSDVLQEAYLVMSHRLDEYCDRQAVSAFVWMRQLTLQKLIDLQRFHFGQKRSPLKESPLLQTSTALSIAQIVAANHTSPSGHAMRQEELARLKNALETMSEMDREVVALRHYEQMSNRETAETLGLTEKAASNRYVRALATLKRLLSAAEPTDH